MSRLHRSRLHGPGIHRRVQGRGFSYTDPRGRPVDDETRARIDALVIPPAWTDVWICPDPDGHIQATGTDAAGRTQYRYHDRWSERRSAAKFHRIEAFAHGLPDLRASVSHDIAGRGIPRERVLACAVRLLDATTFRIGSRRVRAGERLLRLDHHPARPRHGRADTAVFHYRAKGGRAHARRPRSRRDPRDPCAAPPQGGGPRLFVFANDDRFVPITRPT